MTTSGTIGQTVFTTAKLLEKSIRRCGLNPASLTAETVATAKEDLFLLLMSLSNKGLNLWTVDRQLIALIPYQAGYILPIGTLDILNALLSTPSLVTGTSSSVSLNRTQYVFDSADQKITRFGIKLSSTATSVNLYSSTDGITTIQTQSFSPINGVMVAEQLYWFDIDPSMIGGYLDVEVITTSLTDILDTVYFDQGCSSIPIVPFNRDDYSNQPRKTFSSSTITNYWFEKLVTPRFTLWPVPNLETKCIEIFRYRQVQDIGDLTDELEIPARWFEAICWHLSLRLCFELPGVDPGRITMVQEMTKGMTFEVEAGETDNAPTYFAPAIGVYTR